MKTVAMVPLLLNSTRIPDKNLLLVDGYPMAYYVINACKASGVFDEIYINSEHDEIARFAEWLGVSFFKRAADAGGSTCQMTNKSRDCGGARCQTHDHFLYAFMKQVSCDVLVQVHTTSPLIKTETIAQFVKAVHTSGCDSAFTVEERHTETLHDGQPLNFSLSRKLPTQELPPTQIISWAMSAWKVPSFIASYERDDPSENGPTFCGNVTYFPLDVIEALDADNWTDLYLIEAALQYRRLKQQPGEFKWSPEILGIESDLPSLIGRDGVTRFESAGANARLSNLDEIKRKMGPAPWIYVLVWAGTDQTGLICQLPGEGARRHYHVTHDEWWVVLEGTFEWRLADGSVVAASKNDVVFLPRGTSHSIVCTSPEAGIRLANGARFMEHIYLA
jgi:CMP-N-acetylneuraminic acid synthetase/mannose-6-phosphate isomerase-like protein (cupin superfamily)